MRTSTPLNSSKLLTDSLSTLHEQNFCQNGENMNGTIRVLSILDRFPDVESIFTLYEVDTSTLPPNITIEELCESQGIDIEDLLMDLEDAVEDSKNTEWLSVGSEDQWTEGFTEESEVQSNAKFDDEPKSYDEMDDGFETEF